MRKLMNARLFFLYTCIFFHPSLMAQESAFVRRDTNLHTEPRASSNMVLILKANSEVLLNGRKGLWADVSIEGTRGWTKVTALAFSQQTASMTTLSNLATGRSGAGNGVAVTGVRGLDAEELTLA